MNNLKRIFSLALATVMVLGMMVVGASATDYVDDEKIVNKTAVETLAALGIMNGDERGFRPEDGLTRAEAAKMLAKLHNKGRDVTYGVKDTPTFKDIKGHWAEGNIEYAYAFGIAGGKGNGIFDPQGSLKVVELARMCLNMMGYDEGRTGSDWELQTTVLADNLDLFKGLESYIPSANVTRDEAAQILFNALEATMAGDATYDKPTSTTPKVYKVAVVAQASLSNDQKAALEALEFETASDANAVAQSYGTIGGSGFKYTVVKGDSANTVAGTTKAPESLGHKYLGMSTVPITVNNITVNDKGKYVVNTNYTVDNDPSELMGLSVKAIVKLNNDGSLNKTYGFTAVGKVVFEGTVGDIVTTGFTSTNKTIKLGGTAFKTTENSLANTPIVSWNSTSIGALDNFGAAKKEYAIKAISNNSKGTIDQIIAMPAAVEEVKFVSATSITVGNAAYSIKDEEVTGYEGLKRGDLVLVTDPVNTVDGVAVLAKPETVTGTVTGLRSTSALIDGDWYAPADAVKTGDTLALGKEFNLTLVNGYYVLAKLNTTATVSNDILYVTKVDTAGNFDGNHEFIGVTVNGTSIRGMAAKVGAAAPNIYTAYTYEVKDNIYYLTAVADTDGARAGYEKVYVTDPAGFVAAGSGTSATLGGKLIADDANVVVLHDNRASATDANVDSEETSYNFSANTLRKTSTATGADAKKWKTALGASNSTTTKNVIFTETVNGIEYVKLAIVVSALTDLPDASGSGIGYGYVLSAPYSVSYEGRTYTTYDIWNGEAKVTVKDTVTTSSTIAAGDYISFSTVDEAANIITATELATTKVAVTGYSAKDGVLNVLSGGAGTTAGTAASGKVDDDTVYIYLNHAENTGLVSTGVELAEEVPGTIGRYYANAVVVTSLLSGTHKVVFVDVNNNIDDTTINAATITNAATPTVSITTTGLSLGTDGTDGKLTLATTAATTDGGVLTYKWESSADGSTWTEIEGATGATLTVETAAQYRVTVTNTNNSVNGTKTATATDTATVTA